MNNTDCNQIAVGSLILIVLIIFYCLFYPNNVYHEKYQNNDYNGYYKNYYGGDDICNKKNHEILQHVLIYNPDDVNDSYIKRQSRILSKNYYEINEVCPELNFIYTNINSIKKEVQSVIFNNEWNIYPFTAFGVNVNDNCHSCLNLWRFLQRLPGLKLAYLDRLGPRDKTIERQSWDPHSNNVIRCYFGFDIPYGCYLSVRDNLEDDEEIIMQKGNQWTLFDDSRYCYEYNTSDRERIVLIVDIERPDTIKKGTSEVTDTKELLHIVDYIRFTNRL